MFWTRKNQLLFLIFEDSFLVFRAEIELVREINADLRSVAESQLSIMNHELKLLKNGN